MDIKYLSLLNQDNKLAVKEILNVNEVSNKFGVSLSYSDASKLLEVQSKSLKKLGRIDFGLGVVHRLHVAFYDSPYVHFSSYYEAIEELIDLFYYYKNESLDSYSDELLIKTMRALFDKGHGSLTYLNDRLLNNINVNVKNKQEDLNLKESSLDHFFNEEDE